MTTAVDTPDFQLELALHLQGYRFIAGLDEAGRGAWAGPVVAAAVILPLDRSDLADVLRGVRDSKQLTPARRAVLFEVIRRVALAVAVGVSAPCLIDRQGILPATRRAMLRALARLACSPDYLILDHLRLPALALPQFSAARADARFLSVAAASIIAKVTRDRLMTLLDLRYPGYGLAQHKGYGTPSHRAALSRLGASPIHRRSFAPVRQAGPLNT